MIKSSGANDVTQNAIQPGGIESPGQVATYIADVSLELRNMAKGSGFEFLAYLLEMTFQEAFDLSQQQQKEKAAMDAGQG